MEQNQQSLQRVENPYANLPAPRTASALVEIEARRNAAELMIAVEVARRFPRNPREAFDRIMTDFTRPDVAEEAQYEYPRGGTKIKGLSIRAAEVIARHWGNIRRGFIELDRIGGENGKPGHSIIETYAWDLQTNVSETRRMIVMHQRDREEGGKVLTSERDIDELCANKAQRRVRSCILDLIDNDVKEAAANQADATIAAKNPVTPETIKKILEAFDKRGVTRKMIEARIQRSVDAFTPMLVIQFKRILASIKDGMSAPEDWFDLTIGKEPEGETRTEQIKNLLAQKLTSIVVPADAEKNPYEGIGTSETTAWTGTGQTQEGEAAKQVAELAQELSKDQDPIIVLARAIQGTASDGDAYKIAEGASHLGLKLGALSSLIKDITHHHELKPTTVKAVLAEIERRATA